MRDRRIALCHEWTTTFGGSDQVAARMAAALNIDDVYTFAAEPQMVERLFPGRHVRVHRRGRSAIGRSRWQWLLPLMPSAWSRLNLSPYDAVLTSSHACTNAVHAPPNVPHISYCYTPMRYAWQWRSEIGRLPMPARPFWPGFAAGFRAADRRWSQRVTLYMSVSRTVAQRIRRSYSRSSVVVYPPVDTSFWTPNATTQRDDYFLVAGRMVAYKRVDLAVAAAEEAGVRLVVAGSGPDLARIRAKAGATVTFVEQPSTLKLRDLYRRAKALVFAGVEDFGLTLVEAQACGTPVVAFGRGGALESVQDGATGRLYEDPASLAQILRRFDASAFALDDMRTSATRFEASRFDEDLRYVIEAVMDRSGAAPADDLAERLDRDLEIKRK